MIRYSLLLCQHWPEINIFFAHALGNTGHILPDQWSHWGVFRVPGSLTFTKTITHTHPTHSLSPHLRSTLCQQPVLLNNVGGSGPSGRLCWQTLLWTQTRALISLITWVKMVGVMVMVDNPVNWITCLAPCPSVRQADRWPFGYQMSSMLKPVQPSPTNNLARNYNEAYPLKDPHCQDSSVKLFAKKKKKTWANILVRNRLSLYGWAIKDSGWGNAKRFISDAECAIELINWIPLKDNGAGMGTREENTIHFLCWVIELQVPTY